MTVLRQKALSRGSFGCEHARRSRLSVPALLPTQTSFDSLFGRFAPFHTCTNASRVGRWSFSAKTAQRGPRHARGSAPARSKMVSFRATLAAPEWQDAARWRWGVDATVRPLALQIGGARTDSSAASRAGAEQLFMQS